MKKGNEEHPKANKQKYVLGSLDSRAPRTEADERRLEQRQQSTAWRLRGEAEKDLVRN